MIHYIESSGFYETHAHEKPVEVSHFEAKRQKLKHRIATLICRHRVGREAMVKALAIVNAKALHGVHDTDLETLERVLDGIAIAHGVE